MRYNVRETSKTYNGEFDDETKSDNIERAIKGEH